jgi:pimeloyl-ACP methyl ester carboxylesterase
VNLRQPLVILIHGLDGDRGTCSDLSRLMQEDGFQTATFAYPGDQPLDESAALLGRNLHALHDLLPNQRIELVTESMGGLVARQYVEGPQYAGGVDRLILIAPPNGGSGWTRGAILLKLAVNAFKWKNDPDWSPAWMITEGICQAAGDLRPQSEFLRQLNSRPRRVGVRYTIVAGDEPLFHRYEANLLAAADCAIGSDLSQLWGVQQLKRTIESHELRLAAKPGASDGPVTLASAELPGVSDFVLVHADHLALYESDPQSPQ